jgi:hypothetical protein
VTKLPAMSTWSDDDHMDSFAQLEHCEHPTAYANLTARLTPLSFDVAIGVGGATATAALARLLGVLTACLGGPAMFIWMLYQGTPIWAAALLALCLVAVGLGGPSIAFRGNRSAPLLAPPQPPQCAQDDRV